LRGEVQESLRRMGEHEFEEYKRSLRRRERHSRRLERVSRDTYHEDHPGHPLGRGYPTGSPIRMDESHTDGWMRIIRDDPCVFCGGPAGTIDHIEPQVSAYRPQGYVVCRGAELLVRQRRLHDWTNFAAACEGCNGSKASLSLLMMLRKRKSKPRRVRDWGSAAA
jgi:5-methylcytosine-specific restriction endonuclease McrA